MNSWKNRIAVAAVSLIVAAGTAEAQTYKKSKERLPVAEDSQRYAPESSRYDGDATYNYFFNNPGKYRGIRSNRGEYYPGAIRR